jgi:cysteine-rich repeat protein
VGHGYILDDESPPPLPICGNGLAQDPETCDDGDNDFTPGDQCSGACEIFHCGVPTKKLTLLPKAGDALFVLKAAVEQTNCAFEVCDVSGNKIVQASDALLILKKAVGQSVNLACPVENG